MTTKQNVALHALIAGLVLAMFATLFAKAAPAAINGVGHASQCESADADACINSAANKPDTPLMITPVTGVFTDEPRFEWRHAAFAEAYILSITELNSDGAIIATFSRNITREVSCHETTCAVSSASLGFRLQQDAAQFKYRLIASNDRGSSATPKTTVLVQ